MTTLNGKVAVVTGASRGIGREITLSLARAGASVVMVARTVEPGGRLPGSLRQTEDMVRAAGGECLSIGCDLTDPEQVDRLAATALAWKGRVDILVNNAAFLGRATFHSLDELTLANWQRQVGLNVTAPLLLAKAFAPSMRANHGGVIVNMTSSAGDLYEGVVPGIAYGTTKAALNRLTLALARDLRADGVAVFAVDPGYVRTETAEQAADHPGWEIDIADAHPPAFAADVVTQLVGRDPDEVTCRIWGTVAGQPPVLRHDGRGEHRTWLT